MNITFCFISCGEETAKECLAAISPFRDKIVFQEVCNVCPQIKALNQMIEQVETPYLVPLDADMILDSNAYERIHMAVDKYCYDPHWHSILFNLYDTLTEQEILALKVLRTSIVKTFPFKDVPTPDVEHFQRLTHHGYTCIQTYLGRGCIGKHVVKGRYYCYHKYRDVYMTLRSCGFTWDNGVFKGGDTIREKSKAHFDYFVWKWLETENDDYLWCIAGMTDGLTSELEGKSKSFQDKKLCITKKLAIHAYMEWYMNDTYTLTAMPM